MRLDISETVQVQDIDDWFWRVSRIRKGGPFLAGYFRVDDMEGDPGDLIDPFAV